MIAFFCRCCYLHDRATIRLSDDVPQLPCRHYGEDETACKRTDWSMRQWFCLRCERIGRTTIVQSPNPPEGSCPVFPRTHVHAWTETEESRWVMAQARYTHDTEEAS